MADPKHPADVLADRLEDAESARLHLLPYAAEMLRRIPALEADRNSWQQQASDRLDDALQFAAERDALRAEVERALCKAHKLKTPKVGTNGTK